MWLKLCVMSNFNHKTMNKFNFSPIVFFLIFSAFTTSSCQQNFDERMQHEAEEFTKSNCPQEPEAGTRLDSVAYSPKLKTYTMYYSLSATNEALYREQSALLHYMLRQRLIDNTDYKEVKDHRVTFAYVYRSQTTGTVVYETQIKAEEYK